ncbi:MAG: HDOD domain-containing protein [Acidimicrobiia bacterium]
MTKSRILFVDDEERILSGLRRMLRPFHNQWDMSFVDSGAAALEALDANGFDLVVSDMRMPGMDGIELLAEVREAHPEVVRIILSGYSDQVDTLRSTGVAHQYLAKPCDAEIIRNTVSKASALREELSDPDLLAVIAGTTRLPSAPTLYQELSDELAGPDPSLPRVAKIVGRDPAMAAKILQIVNSAFFGLRNNISDIGQAVSLLGIDTIMALVLTTHVFRQPGLGGKQAAAVDGIWHKSLGVATMSEAIMRAEGGSSADTKTAFLAGLLHDCGKLVFASNRPDDFWRVDAEGGGREQEIATFGADHAIVGAHLLAVWGLPDDIVEAVAYHHRPSVAVEAELSALAAVHIAVALENRDDASAPLGLDRAYLAAAGLGDHEEQWLSVAWDLEYERENP